MHGSVVCIDGLLVAQFGIRSPSDARVDSLASHVDRYSAWEVVEIHLYDSAVVESEAHLNAEFVIAFGHWWQFELHVIHTAYHHLVAIV